METFNDITREMRAYAKKSEIDGGPIDVWDWLREFADRLDEAYKRDMQSIVEANETAMKTATDEVARLRVENARLKAALKPVMAYDYKQTCNLDDFMASVHCINIINEAQRIYNGGAE